MPTPTKRPLKKGDPCWIRIQRKGKPVLAEYLEQFSSKENKLHAVIMPNGEDVHASFFESDYLTFQAIFVAKPTQGISNEQL